MTLWWQIWDPRGNISREIIYCICRKIDPYTHKNQYIHTSILKYLEENISTFTALGCKHKTDKKEQT